LPRKKRKGKPLPGDGLDVNGTVSIVQSMGYLMGYPGADLFKLQNVWGEKHKEPNDRKNRDKDFSNARFFHFIE
jgi:hypothetical protein